MTDNEPTATEINRRGVIKQAIAAFTQSEKVKSGLIWVCQLSDQVSVMDGPDRQSGLLLLKTLAHLVADETLLAARVTGDGNWNEIGKKINQALVMINSGVPQETGFHLTQALARVTRIGGRAAAVLKKNGYF